MLQVQFIREHKQTVLDGLAKRNFANAAAIIEDVLTFDETRRATQTQLDIILAESNKISKEIGQLFFKDHSNSTRGAIWDFGLQTIKDSPWIGHGNGDEFEVLNIQ